MIKKRIHRYMSLFIILSIIIQLIPIGSIKVKANTNSIITSVSGNEYTVPHKIVHEFDINDGDINISYAYNELVIKATQGAVTVTWGKGEASSVVIRGSGTSANKVLVSTADSNVIPSVYLVDLEWNGQIAAYGTTNIYILGSLTNYNSLGLLYNEYSGYIPSLIGYDRDTKVSVNYIIPGSSSTDTKFVMLTLSNLDIVCKNISGGSTTIGNISAPRVVIENCNIISTSDIKEYITPKTSMSISNSTLTNAKIGTYSTSSMVFTATNSELYDTSFYLGYTTSTNSGDLNFINSVFTGATYCNGALGGPIAYLRMNNSFVDLKTSSIGILEASASTLILSNSAATTISSAKFNRVSANSNNAALTVAVKDLSSNPLYFKMIRIKNYPNRNVSVSFDDGFPVTFKTDDYGYIYPYLSAGSTYAELILLDENGNETNTTFKVTYPAVTANSTTVHPAVEDSNTGGDQSELIASLESQIALLTEQLTQANNTKSTLQAENDSLKSQITILDETITDLKNQITLLTNQLAESNSNNDLLIAEIESLNDQITILNNQVVQLENNLAIANSEKSALEIHITTLNSTVTNLNLQITTLNELLATSESENEELRGQVNTLTTQINVLLSEIETLQEDLSLLQTENNELKTQVSNFVSENTSLLSAIVNMQNLLNSANLTMEELEERIVSLTASNANLKNELDILTQSNLALSTQINVLTSQNITLQNEVNRLQDLLDNAYQAIEELEGKVDELTSLISSLENQLKTAINDKNTLQVENDSLKSQIILLNDRISSLEQTIEQLRSEGENSADLIISLNDTIKELNEQISSLQSDLNNANTNISHLEITIVNLTNNITLLENEVSLLIEKVNKLEGEKSVLESTIQTLNETITNLELGAFELNNQINILKTEKMELQTLLSEAINTINNYKTLIYKIKTELGIEEDKDIIPAIKELKEKIDLEISKNESLQIIINTITNDLDAAKQENLNLISQLDSLKELVGASDTEDIATKIEELLSTIEEQNTRIEQLEKEKINLIEKLDEAVNKNHELLLKIEELQKIIGSSDNELAKEISNLKDQIAELSKENKDLEFALEQLSKDSNELAKENQFLKGEITRLESLLDTANSTINELRELVASLKVENELLKQQIKDIQNTPIVPSIPSTPSVPSNNEYYQNLISEKEKEIKDLKSELIISQKEIEDLKNNKVELPDDSTMLIIVKEQGLKSIIKEKATAPIDDKVTAKKGWEIADTLNSEWVKVIDLDDVIRDKDSSEYSFFAREVNNQDKIYYITVNVLVKSDIPSLTLPKTIYLGYKFKLNLGNVEDGNVVFTSSDTSIAKVNKNGVITPISIGTATITGEVFKDNCLYKFTVEANIKDGGSTLNLKDGNTQTVSDTPILTMYKLIMQGRSTKLEINNLSKESTVQYITSNAEIVTVDKNGVMKGNKNGNATVTVIIGQGNNLYTYIVKVRVNDGTKDTNMWEYLIN